ncbi:hypothetical protein RQP46_009325 [Phenoliferia psychrophenolica]
MTRSRYALLGVLALAASSQAIAITTPAKWTTTGPNVISWVSVDTDPSTFAAILVNQNTALLSASVLLETSVDTNPGSGGTFTVTPASGDPFPAGPSYQVNFIKDANDPDTIYAQTNMFDIYDSDDTETSITTAGATKTVTVTADKTSKSKSTDSTSTDRDWDGWKLLCGVGLFQHILLGCWSSKPCCRPWGAGGLAVAVLIGGWL